MKNKVKMSKEDKILALKEYNRQAENLN